MAVGQRLRLQVEPRGACVEWVGTRNADGYGRVFVERRRWFAHRLSWVLHRGAIPDGMVVMHTCDNPACVAIEHLRLGTQAENNRDRHEKGRTKVPVRRGNRWTGSIRAVSLLALAACSDSAPDLDCERVNPTSVPAVEAHRCREAAE